MRLRVGPKSTAPGLNAIGKEVLIAMQRMAICLLNPIADGRWIVLWGESLHLEPGAEEKVYYWLILRHNLKDVRTGNRELLKKDLRSGWRI